MNFSLGQIPSTTDIPANPEPTQALSLMRKTSHRRTVLRAVLLGAATIGATAATFSGRFTSPAWAENGPGGLKGFDRNDCKDAYPNGYAEQGSNDGSTAPAACFGGEYRGSSYCKNGWHRKETKRDGQTTYKYVPISTACGPRGSGGPKNAWKWKLPNGTVYRCSDGNTTVSERGQAPFSYFSICVGKV